MGWLLLGSLVLGVLGVWLVVAPRSVYWTLSAWQYRNPEAVEPSDVSYGIGRVTGAVLCVIAVAGIVAAFAGGDDETEDDPTPTTMEAEGQQADDIDVAQGLARRFDQRLRELSAGGPLRVPDLVMTVAGDLGAVAELDADFSANGQVTLRDERPGQGSFALGCVELPVDPVQSSVIGWSTGLTAGIGCFV